MDRPTDPLATTQDVYERLAHDFDRQRNKTLFEAPWLERFCSDLPPGARILDLGCGSGEPIAAALITKQFRITGVDFSTALLALAQQRFPDNDWIHGDLRELDLGRSFDGVIAWHVLFHLTPDDQRLALPRLLSHLRCGGRFMATLTPVAGETCGWVGGEAVYHGGLAPDEYCTLLERHGLVIDEFVISDPDCGGATVLLGTRNAPASGL